MQLQQQTQNLVRGPKFFKYEILVHKGILVALSLAVTTSTTTTSSSSSSTLHPAASSSGLRSLMTSLTTCGVDKDEQNAAS
jgi:hypothetical protein